MTHAFSLIPDAVSFSLENAHAMALAAELAYSSAREIESRVCEWGFGRCHFADRAGTQAFVAIGNDAILVAFRGTEPSRIEDWMTDGNYRLVSGPLKGHVHAGFYGALSNVWREIDRRVSAAFASTALPIWVTGHSLGGGLATLAVARWLEEGRMIAGLYTFGQPRTGDATFARNFNFAFKPQAFRFVNDSDLVTRVPPRSMGYSHTGTFKFFTELGELVDDISWWKRFLNEWNGALDDILGWMGDGLTDHRMTEYIRLLEIALDRESRTADQKSQSDELSENLARFLSSIRPAVPPSLPIRPRRRAA